MARVQANVAKMRAANAPESDVLAYLQHEDSIQTSREAERIWEDAQRGAVRPSQSGGRGGGPGSARAPMSEAEAAWYAGQPDPVAAPAQGMNPELRRLLVDARAAGASDADLNTLIARWESDNPGNAHASVSFRNIARSLTQGATFGWGDELKLTDRARAAAFHAEHPIVDFAAKTVGGLLAPAVAVAAAPELATAGGAAALGAGIGLLSGAGESESETLAGRAKDAAIGGTVGAAAGPMLRGALTTGAGRVVTGMGAATGAAVGAYKGGSLKDAAGGAVLGAAVVNTPKVGAAVLDRFVDSRAPGLLGAAVRNLLPDAERRMTEVNSVVRSVLGPDAPAAASLATSAAPMARTRLASSSLIPIARAVGHSPQAAVEAARDLATQSSVLGKAARVLGKQMGDVARGQQVPVNPALVSAMKKVDAVLGIKTPAIHMPPPIKPVPFTEVPTSPDLRAALRAAEAFVGKANIPEFHMPAAGAPVDAVPYVKPADLRRTVTALRTASDGMRAAYRGVNTEKIDAARVALTKALTAARPTDRAIDAAGGKVLEATPFVRMDEARRALSELRYLGRVAGKRGVEASGITKLDITRAKTALQDALHAHSPVFANMDKKYAILAAARQRTDALQEVVARSAGTHSANKAFKVGAGSLGGSIHSPKGAVFQLMDRALTNQKGVSDAVSRYLTKPGVSMNELIARVPKASPFRTNTGAAIAATTPSQVRGLLFPPE